MDDIKERLLQRLTSEETRYAYADTVTNAFVAAQIRSLREKNGLSQERLAEIIGTKQSGVSRLERADYSSWKVETLRKIARAFKVRLRIRFEGFGTLYDEVGTFDDKNLIPPAFEDDPSFKEPSEVEHVSAGVQQMATIEAGDLVAATMSIPIRKRHSEPRKSGFTLSPRSLRAIPISKKRSKLKRIGSYTNLERTIWNPQS